MATDTLASLKGKVPDAHHDTAMKLSCCGFSPLCILALLVQCGPQFSIIAQKIIDAFANCPVPKAVVGHHCSELLACQREHLVAALCDNLCMEKEHAEE